MLSQPVNGTDDKNAHIETKKAYLTFLNNIMVNKLHAVFLSDRKPLSVSAYPKALSDRQDLTVNKGWLPALLESIQRVSEDISDPASSRTAIQFFGRCVLSWGQLPSAEMQMNGTVVAQALPGFEQFMYDGLIPMAFRIASLPTFNPKDGQTLLVSLRNPLSKFKS